MEPDGAGFAGAVLVCGARGENILPARAGRLRALALDGALLPSCREALAARTAIFPLRKDSS